MLLLTLNELLLDQLFITNDTEAVTLIQKHQSSKTHCKMSTFTFHTFSWLLFIRVLLVEGSANFLQLHVRTVSRELDDIRLHGDELQHPGSLLRCWGVWLLPAPMNVFPLVACPRFVFSVSFCLIIGRRTYFCLGSLLVQVRPKYNYRQFIVLE